jgi:hypothetical protein
MNKMTISALMFAVAVAATGCKKADNDPSTGPAQEAGKAIDNTAAAAAQDAKEGVTDCGSAFLGVLGADRAGQNMKEAGAEVRQESKEAAANVKEGAADATAKAGKGLERAGEKMQDASK